MTKDERNKVDLPNTSFAFACGLALVFAIFLLSRHDFLKKSSSDQVIKITTNNNFFECSKGTKNQYIGKTDHFVFIYSDSLHSSVVIPLSEVKIFEFDKK